MFLNFFEISLFLLRKVFKKIILNSKSLIQWLPIKGHDPIYEVFMVGRKSITYIFYYFNFIFKKNDLRYCSFGKLVYFYFI